MKPAASNSFTKSLLLIPSNFIRPIPTKSKTWKYLCLISILIENQTNDLKNTLSVTLETLDATKIIQQGDSSKSEKGAYSGKNDSKAKKEILQSEQQSNTLSEESKMPLKPLSKNQQYNRI